jgi:hypothetical protein
VINLNNIKSTNKIPPLKLSLIIILSIFTVFLTSSYFFEKKVGYNKEPAPARSEHTYLFFFKEKTNPDLKEFIQNDNNYVFLDNLNAIVVTMLPDKFETLKIHKDIENAIEVCNGYNWRFNYTSEERNKIIKAMERNNTTRYNVWFEGRYTKEVEKYLIKKDVDIISLDDDSYSDMFIVMARDGQEENIENSKEVNKGWKMNAAPVREMTKYWISSIICHRPTTEITSVKMN